MVIHGDRGALFHAGFNWKTRGANKLKRPRGIGAICIGVMRTGGVTLTAKILAR